MEERDKVAETFAIADKQEKRRLSNFFGSGRSFVIAAEKGDTEKALDILKTKSIYPTRIVDAIGWATRYGHMDTVLQIIRNIKVQLQPMMREYAFLKAVLYDRAETAVILQEAGNTYLLDGTNFVVLKDMSPLIIATSEQIDNKAGLELLRYTSPLFIATLFNNVNVVSALLNKEADPNLGNYSCLEQAKKLGYTDCVKLLEASNAASGLVYLDMETEISTLLTYFRI